MRSLLTRLALDAPVPVFAVSGIGGRELVQDLRLRPEVRLLDTPAAANVLLVAGAIPDELADSLARAHDALSHPRSTVVWQPGEQADNGVPSWPFAVRAEPKVGLLDVLIRVHRDVLTGRRPSDTAVLPDVDPAPWRGVGPYGQGGSGMTGGTPYGRPMAELAPDRDGLRLDVLPVRIGPFYPRLPTGLVLDVRFSGDVVLEAAVASASLRPIPGNLARPGLRPFLRALLEPVSVAELELARAREHLRWAADALVAHGLPSLAERAVRLVHGLRPGEPGPISSFATSIAWTQVLRWSTAGVGTLSAERLEGLGVGPVARAAGLSADARRNDPAYDRLGFEPVVEQGGDAAARWRQRLAEAVQSVELAGRAGDARTEPGGAVESPRGRLEASDSPTARLLALLPELLAGLEWGDAVTTLVSLDLDLEEAAAVEPEAIGKVAA